MLLNHASGKPGVPQRLTVADLVENVILKLRSIVKWIFSCKQFIINNAEGKEVASKRDIFLIIHTLFRARISRSTRPPRGLRDGHACSPLFPDDSEIDYYHSAILFHQDVRRFQISVYKRRLGIPKPA